MQRFRQLGFSRAAIRDAQAIRFSDRAEALAGNMPRIRVSVFFVTEYRQFWPSLSRALRRYWLAVESCPALARRFEDPPMVSYQGHRSLQARLT